MKKLLLLTISALLLISTSAICQPPPEPQTPPPPDCEEMREKVRTMKMWKLTEELDLTEDQAVKFFPLFRKFENEVQELRDENGELTERLKGYLIAKEEGKKIEEIIVKIEKNDVLILEARTKFRKDAGKVLDTGQIGKLIIFQHEFPKRFREAIRGGKMHHKRQPGDKPGKRRGPMGMRGGFDRGGLEAGQCFGCVGLRC